MLMGVSNSFFEHFVIKVKIALVHPHVKVFTA